MRRKKVDVLVVGGGIIGCSSAYFLARNGREVILIEKLTSVGLEASGVNAGGLTVQASPFAFTHLNLESAELWRTFSKEIGYDLGYHRVGGFRVAENKEEFGRLLSIAKKQRKCGLDVKTLDGAETRKIAPYLGDSIIGANYTDLDGYTDALKALKLIEKAAIKLGVKVVTETSVLEISPKPKSGYIIKTTRGDYEARQVLIAAGIWSKEITKSLGVNLPIKLRINQMMVTDQSPPLIKHMITHVNGNLTLKQLPEGSIIIGGGWPGKGDLITNTKGPTYESIIGNASLARRVVPSMKNISIIRIWAGFDGRTVDQVPIMCEIPGNPGAYLAIGCFGGYMTGPLEGRLMAEKMCTGTSSIPIDEFSLTRYDQEIKISYF